MKPPSNIYRRNRPLAVSATTPDRNERCRVKELCPSCKAMDEDYSKYLDKKFTSGIEKLTQLDLLKGANVIKAHASPRKTQYRCHVKLAVRARRYPEDPSQRFAIGMFFPGSHHLVDATECPVHARGLNELLREIRNQLDASPLAPYDEESHSGDIRYILLRQAHHTGGVMLTFVTTSDIKRPLKEIIRKLRIQNFKIVSAHMNINSEVTNVILGKETSLVFGADKIRESVCDLSFEVSPTAFFQINPWMAEQIYRRIEQLAGATTPTKHSVAWDFYCGIGQISFVLARLGYNTLGIEENPFAIEDAEHNSRLNDLVPNTLFLAGRTEDVQFSIPLSHSEPNLIVVNPSRRGIAPISLDFIAKAMKRTGSQLIYLSCEIDTLVRDLDILKKEHGFKLRQLEAFDMFPYTPNLEWLAVITV